MEPVVVKTVSKCKVSADVEKEAFGLVMNASFLQEEKKMTTVNRLQIIALKNNLRSMIDD